MWTIAVRAVARFDSRRCSKRVRQLRIPCTRTMSSRSNPETLRLCHEIIDCKTVDEVSLHFKSNDTRYHVYNHVAALNAIACKDASRKASGNALAHIAVLERFLAPVLHQLSPRETACICYLFSIYGHQMSAKMHRLLSSHMVYQLDLMAKGISPPLKWHGLRAEKVDGWSSLTDIPQKCFTALHGAGGVSAPQDVALASWALARQAITSPPIFASLAEETAVWLRETAADPRRFTDDSMLRVCWAFARANVQHEEVSNLLADTLCARVHLHDVDKARSDHALTMEQKILLLWCLAHVAPSHAATALLSNVVFDRSALEKLKGNVQPGVAQQLYQTFQLLKLRRVDAAALNQELPLWLWDGSDKSAAPKESDPYDALYTEISKILKRLGYKHVRQYAIDGFSIDIAFPGVKVGLEVVNKVAALSAMTALQHAPPASLRPGSSKHAVPSSAPVIDAPDATKLEYLAGKGWDVLQLDYGLWRKMPQNKKIEHIISLLQTSALKIA